MSERDDLRQATAKVLEGDEIDGVLSKGFYRPGPRPVPAPRATKTSADRPTHYKVICISMYTDDLERLDRMVDALKARGMTKANRSALIRYALGTIEAEAVPKGI